MFGGMVGLPMTPQKSKNKIHLSSMSSRSEGEGFFLNI